MVGIDKVFFDLAYLECVNGEFVLKQGAPSVSFKEIARKTAGTISVQGDIPEMSFE